MNNSFLLYIGIFIAKLIEVALMTIRNVLINKGHKLVGAIIGFFEVLIWLFVVSTVLQNVTEDFMKVFIYCFAFACGNYLGVAIEEKLAMGMAIVEVLVKKCDSKSLIDIIRENGHGVTTIDCEGKENKMQILKIYLKRKQIKEVIDIITKNSPSSIFSVSDTKNVMGGYIKK